MQQFAQGDVLLTNRTDLPKNLQPHGKLSPAQPVGARWILALGEATGHSHSVVLEGCFVSLDEGGTTWLTVEQLTEVTHPEHGAVVLEPGTYRVDRQRELGWEGWQAVRD